jgi:hypothetical protein
MSPGGKKRSVLRIRDDAYPELYSSRLIQFFSPTSSGTRHSGTMSSGDGKFDRLCALLVMPHSVMGGGDIDGYGRRLGDALLHNTTVQQLTLTVDSLFSLPEATAHDGAAAASLLQYLRSTSSSALNSVTLTTTLTTNSYNLSPHLQNLLHQIVYAVAFNARVTTVDVRDLRFLSSVTLSHLLKTTSSLTKLTFYDRYNASNVVESQHGPQNVAQALRSNHTVQDLKIVRQYVPDEDVSNDPILLQLATHPTSLRTLSLVLCSEPDQLSIGHFQVLATMLESTTTLESFELGNYQFDRESLRFILDALQVNTSLTKLSFQDCPMSEEATSDLTQFVQEHCNRNGSVLNEVCIKMHSPARIFENSTVENVATNMLIGSRLTRFALREGQPDHNQRLMDFELRVNERSDPNTVDMGAFFTTLTENEPMIQLSDLHLEYLRPNGADALCNFLSNTTRLQKLVVTHLERGVHSTPILAALRKNGSLHSVSITQLEADLTWFQTRQQDEMDRTSVRIYQRDDNAELPVQPFFTNDELRLV